jgi:hypothetical protein
MLDNILDINEKISLLEYRIDNLIDDVAEDKRFKSARAEEKLLALLFSLKYLKEKREKIKQDMDMQISRKERDKK